MKLPLISKIFEDASKIRSKKDRVVFLRSHHPNKTMLKLLKYAYDPSIVWLLPEGAPPYTKNEELDPEYSGLYQEDRKLYLFLQGGNEGITPLKREMLFVQLLESINPKEAELLIAVKDRTIPYKGVTKEVVKEAFPNLL